MACFYHRDEPRVGKLSNERHRLQIHRCITAADRYGFWETLDFSAVVGFLEEIFFRAISLVLFKELSETPIVPYVFCAAILRDLMQWEGGPSNVIVATVSALRLRGFSRDWETSGRCSFHIRQPSILRFVRT